MWKQSLFFLICLPSFLFAQHKVSIIIKSLPSYHQDGADIYIAGSFNNWNPGDKNYKLEYDDGEYGMKMKLPQGAYEFKFTRGSWEKGEVNPDGSGVPNRELIVTGDFELKLVIGGWQDHFPPAPKISTASGQVMILDTAFYIPQLNRYRRIWVWLPRADYSRGSRHPVLYLHDGQNIFDDSTSFSGEWGVDEFFDTTSLAKSIVVAIDNGGQYRLNEYSPYDMERYGEGQGKEYVEFIVKILKPYIDRRFRTYRDRRHTFIAGSSMGGLISMYAILQYPRVFGGAGIFSPAFWVAPGIFDMIRQRGGKIKGNIFFYAGKKEGDSMVPDMLKALDILNENSRAEIETIIRDEGIHHESAWRKEFPLFYRWIISEQ